MFVILGVVLPENKRVSFALTQLYGIGTKTSKFICNLFSVAPRAKVKDLSEDQKLEISSYIRENYVIETNLRRNIFLNISKQVKNNSTRGYRHRHGLPVRGQRTCSNARTKRRLKYNFNVDEN